MGRALHRFCPGRALLAGVVVTAIATTAAPAAVILADFEDGTTGALNVSGAPDVLSSAVANGEVRITARGGFTPVANMFVTRGFAGSRVEQLLANQLIQFDRRNLPASTDPTNGTSAAGTFINSFVVFQSDVGGANAGFNTLDGSGQFLDPAGSAPSSYSFNYGALAEAQDILTRYNAGEGTFMNVFLIQQTNEPRESFQSAVIYDNVRLDVVPEPAGLALLAAGAGLVMGRRRRRGG
jgi:hypothetical protein